MKKKAYLFANWKMYLNNDESVALAKSLAKESKNISPDIKMVVFPTALALCFVKEALGQSAIGLGAQNVYWVDKGGLTGEVSAAMYQSAGCGYALIGHSERRHLFHETNHETRQKMEAALAAGLTPVLCVGETSAERKSGKTEEVVEAQLRAAFTGLNFSAESEVLVAYEPVWAIGTGEACDPAEAERMAALIEKYVVGLLGKVEPRILYGGSVRAENVRQYLSSPHVNGVLVGGASAKLESWLELVEKSL